MKQNYFLSLLFMVISLATTAQTKEEIELNNRFWSNDSKKNITEIPEKWQNESAVILFYEEGYTYTNNGKKMYNPSFFHQRLKLQDRAAVDNFSEFKYKKDEQVGAGFYNFLQEKSTVGIKIIKPNGDEKILDISSEKITQDEENKIAIPGLEVGDILDIYIYEDDFLRSNTGIHYYEPVEKILSTDYPILYRKLSLEVENDYFLNMESFNGAPKIVEEETDKRATRKYVLEASDIEKSEFPRWFYPFDVLPSLKFQVTFALKSINENNAEVFLSDDDAERKADVTKEEIQEYYGERFSADSRRYVRDVVDYLEDKGITDKREQIIQGLYYIRHMSFNRFIELYLARENEIRYYAEPCDSGFVVLDEDRFVTYMAGLAKQLEIDYDVIVTTPDFNGSLENLLIRSNVVWGIRFNFTEPLYLFSLTPHIQPEYFPSYLEGVNVYKMNVKRDRKLENVKVDKLPLTTAKENKSVENIDISFSTDFKNIKVKRELQFSGHFKTENLSTHLFFGDFLDEEFDRYGTKHFYHCKKRQRNNDEEAQTKMNSLMDSYRERKETYLEELSSNVFDVEVKDYSSEVIEASRYSNDPLIVKDQFSINDEFIKRAGPNYIVEVGKFIGGQVQIKDDEIERNVGVYLDFAKTYEYVVNIDIPEGYEVVGLDKLQKNVTNNTGIFKSSAVIENGALVYTTTKTYSKRKYTEEEWDSMLPWLKTAYDFSQEKVMFKKV
ncbi:DUF3857 domain-containing protein [Marixanthomonas ophiurae]|uniref:DUF3857 domain-containing protein n=1 Tax=Marixanthomonas ophiurae TaxID=387659 RepID=A0A3E1Q6X1_9FLAO|nr:DUF3857 domain-containing protein [Marixanthomonas ophiurae]RFN57871.1 DUF3857 domain-containing protein [Marixanthomonas ophiurae]